MPVNRKTGKNKGIAFALSPDDVHNELLKLNGVEFHGKSLILEEAMSQRKKVNNNDKDSIINEFQLS